MSEGIGRAPDGRRATVVHEADLPMRPMPDGHGTFREPIDARTDCRNLVQRVLRYGPGRSADLRNEVSEEALYVISGRGRAEVDAERLDLEPDTGLYVPPGSTYAFVADGPDDLLLLGVLSPPPGTAGISVGAATAAVTVKERDEEPLPAGDDRYFKLMIDPRFGCRSVTQFVGFIDRSRAPFHTHTYEEVIYILDGEGIVHIGDRHIPIREGSSVFLPPGIPHCLENRSEGVLRLLGVFAPAGSPADKKG